MGFDAILKRYFPAVLCALIALAAYFQASGMGQLVASTVSVDGASAPPPATTRGGVQGAAANQDHATSAAAILSRNPFDSITGPLDGKPMHTSPTSTCFGSRIASRSTIPTRKPARS